MYTKYIAALVAVVLLVGCDSNRFYEENLPVEGQSWASTDAKTFTVDVADTSLTFNAYINLRNSTGYAYQNIYLFLTTTFPNGTKSKDTLNCRLADDRGKWLGKGAGDLVFNQIPIKKSIFFPQKGKYTFTIEQAMRQDPLPGVTDVGFRLETVSTK